MIKLANETIYSLIKENYTLRGKSISNSIDFVCTKEFFLSETKKLRYIYVKDNNGNVNINFRYYVEGQGYIHTDNTDINELIEIIKYIDTLNE